jgi:predicted DNA-binding ribbon-helix-helix protein
VIDNDGPTLEEACLWADLTEIAEERDTARRELAAVLAENARLRARVAALTSLAA